ncbi:octanoate-[acyl-carrier-protein]-protein-N-octanoyltransferase [Geminocystis sp. NIES-3708]|uniref:lipoyl(octanoyl) transferase LipB n=1 Tax=Geminocystis sp. NIES-3708 TaxID=1615909 RepID=UPI0005FC55BF|nr:lipoyl(octanoyl) transferase LipB [Geminocystis sp. NIES-3708]BAQ59621.1 octanoate-[acyl-carrier-protein]-protein-N-octanoyltransferase [Geminocystis sp. NIES-3708]
MKSKIINQKITVTNSRIIEVEDLGFIPYKLAWEYQQKLVKERLENFELPDKLLLVEHPSVYTLGTGSTLENLKFDLNKFSGELYRTERGGEVTFHCQGQIVVYPILNLHYYQKDLHWYLRQLEEVIIQLLAKYNLKSQRINGLTGVWINEAKIAAIGIKVKRWITMHGFALNVCCDLSGFGKIIPCGIKNKLVTRLSDYYPNICILEVKKQLVKTFAEVF